MRRKKSELATFQSKENAIWKTERRRNLMWSPLIWSVVLGAIRLRAVDSERRLILSTLSIVYKTRDLTTGYAIDQLMLENSTRDSVEHQGFAAPVADRNAFAAFAQRGRLRKPRLTQDRPTRLTVRGYLPDLAHVVGEDNVRVARQNPVEMRIFPTRCRRRPNPIMVDFAAAEICRARLGSGLKRLIA